jgi:hypothetical protein
LLVFLINNDTIYDFEYFLDDNNKRIISFGFYAGIMGSLLACLQYVNKILKKTNIINLEYCHDRNTYISYIYQYIYLFNNIKIGIIGNGNCASGVKSILDLLNIDYIIINRQINNNKLESFDILFNCIVLDEDYNIKWFNSETHFYKPIIICDISCDNEKLNNPIAIYNTLRHCQMRK